MAHSSKRGDSKIRAAAHVAVEPLETRALFASTLGNVFYIEMENHNLAQPASVTSPQQLQGNPALPSRARSLRTRAPTIWLRRE